MIFLLLFIMSKSGRQRKKTGPWKSLKKSVPGRFG